VHQGIRPGAPFVYGAGYSALSMRTMVDCYAAPEHFRGTQAGCDLARHYGLPSFSYAAVSDSKVLDEQCAAEYGMTTILGALSGATLLHDVGYLESGLQSSLDSIVLGAELIGWARAFTRKLSLDDWALALDEIALVGPGGNHLARSFTRKHHGDVWHSTIFDQFVHDRWRSMGAQTLKQRLRERTRALTEEPRAFQIELAARDQLEVLLAAAERERASDE
jgi:trimethylamine--corrinoid protein Co-methyltransferase